jgi:hypothetical protein
LRLALGAPATERNDTRYLEEAERFLNELDQEL